MAVMEYRNILVRNCNGNIPLNFKECIIENTFLSKQIKLVAKYVARMFNIWF